MDSASQPDKPPQEDFQGFTQGFINVIGTLIALVTLATPVVSLVLFSAPTTTYDPLMSPNPSPSSPLFSFNKSRPVFQYWLINYQDER